MARFSVRVGTLNRRGFIAASAIAGLAVVGRGRESFADDGLRKLKLGSSPMVNFAAIYRFRAIAKQYGFDVELINFPSGTKRLNALAAGYIDGSPTGSTQPSLLRAKGVPIKIVCDVDRKGKGLMVGAAIRKFEDLRGKDIGTVPGTTSDIWLRQKLLDEGLNPDRDVNLVNMDYMQMPAAVLGGRVTSSPCVVLTVDIMPRGRN